MARPTKAAIKRMTNQEAMVLIDKLGLPEGSAAEQKATLLEHFGYAGEEPEPDPEPGPDSEPED